MKKRRGKSVGGEVRPTTQKILESLAGILQPRLEGALVLDLFAGTGRVGLRMLEEGAEKVVFVEGHKRVAQALRATLRGNSNSALVVGAVPNVLSKVKGEYDLVLCDPPYDWKEPQTLLPAAAPLTKDGGLLVVEHHHKTPYDVVDGWELFREVKFGETRLSFFERLLIPKVNEAPDK